MTRIAKDATEAVAFSALKVDWKGALPVPDKCVWSRAIRRAIKAQWAWVGRTIVYIQYADGRMVRYAHSIGSALLVRKFDRAEDLPINVTHWLLPPPAKRKRPKANGDKKVEAPVRSSEDIKARYARRMADPKASLDRNSSLIICEDGTRIYV